jgi:hypothetical protein
LCRVENSTSVFRTLAALDEILSAYPSFETRQIRQDSAHHSFLLSRVFFYTSSAFSVTFWSQLQGQLRVVGTVESWCIDIVCIYLTGSQPTD